MCTSTSSGAKPRAGRIALPVFFAALAFFTAFAGNSSRAQFFKDEALEKRVGAAEKQVSAIESSLRQVATQVAKLNAEKQELLQLLREMSGVLDDNSFADRKMREEFKAQLDKLSKRVALMIGKANVRITELDKSGQGTSRRLTDLEEKGKEKEKEKEKNTLSAVELYGEAWTSYRRGEMDQSVGQFRRFLERHPTSELAASARYWIGMIFLEQNEPVQAAAEFSGLISANPQSGRVPAAMLALAEAYELSGAVDDAEFVRGRLVARFPGSLAADKARLLLE